MAQGCQSFLEALSEIRQCCISKTCLTTISCFDINIRDVKLEPISDDKLKEIIQEMEDNKIPSVSFVTEKNVDWKCYYMWRFRKGVGKGTKMRRNFTAFLVYSKSKHVYGYEHNTVELKRTLHRWNGNQEAMMRSFAESGLKLLTEKIEADEKEELAPQWPRERMFIFSLCLL